MLIVYDNKHKDHFISWSQIVTPVFYFIKGKTQKKPKNQNTGIKCEMVPLILTWFYLLHQALPHLQIHLHNTEDEKA